MNANRSRVAFDLSFMRLFIAIDLPDSIKDYLRGLLKKLPNAKLSKAHDFHLTLKFLGSCDPERRKRVEEELRNISFKPFDAKLGKLGTFGGSRPRVIWVGMEVPEWLLVSVHDIESRMTKLGFEKENRFAPHLTLARAKFIENPQKFAEELKKITIEPLQFHVEHFYLFESKLLPKGAIHTKLAQY